MEDLGKYENLRLIPGHDLTINSLLPGGHRGEELAESQATGHASAVDTALGCPQKSRANNLHFAFVFYDNFEKMAEHQLDSPP